MVMLMMMMMSPASSLLALVCLGWSCAHDAVRKPRPVLSAVDADPQSILRLGLTPAPTVLPAQTTSTSTEPPPGDPGSTPAPPGRLGEDAALPARLEPGAARLLLPQRRLTSVSDQDQDAGVITTSDNSQGESLILWSSHSHHHHQSGCLLITIHCLFHPSNHQFQFTLYIMYICS